MKNQNCCHECGHRYTACHDFCDTYKAFKDEIKEIKIKASKDYVYVDHPKLPMKYKNNLE